MNPRQRQYRITWIGIILMLVFITVIGCMPDNSPKPTTETKLNIGLGMDAKIINLPTGERVLLITGSDGLATCCLLPPLNPEKKKD